MTTILYYISGVFMSKQRICVAVIEEHEEWLKAIPVDNQEFRLMTLRPVITEFGEVMNEFHISEKLDYCLLPREQIEEALRKGLLWKKATPPKLPLPPFTSMN